MGSSNWFQRVDPEIHFDKINRILRILRRRLVLGPLEILLILQSSQNLSRHFQK